MPLCKKKQATTKPPASPLFFCLLPKPAKVGPFPSPKQYQRAQDNPFFLLLLGATPFALCLKHSSRRLPLPLLFFPKTIPQRHFPLSPAKAFPSLQPQNKPKPAIFNFWSHSRPLAQTLSLSHQPSPALPHTCKASLLSVAHLSATVISVPSLHISPTSSSNKDAIETHSTTAPPYR